MENEFKIGDVVVPVKKDHQQGESWEEAIYLGPFGEDVVQLEITKSEDKLLWATRNENRIRKKVQNG